MKHSSFLFLGLSLFAVAPAVCAASEPTPAVATDKEASAIPQIVKASRLNATSVQLMLTNGEAITLDFYGDNIFRLFRDSAEVLLHNPMAEPPAEMLVKNPRRAPGGLTLDESNPAVCVISTPRLRVVFMRRTCTMKVTDLKNNRDVIEEVAPVVIEKNKVTMRLANSVGNYYYGGGVQNGRFSHAGKVIQIENTNYWVDGGVASPTPFFWSTRGYGIFFHTFRQGRYDFGATVPGQVILSHDTNYLDAFIMVDERPAELLADFYQLTGNPVLLPKFGFYQGHLNAYNRDYWKEDAKGTITLEDGKTYSESQKDNGGVKESLNGEKDNYIFSARAAIERYQRHDMPLGWFLPNDGYGAGYGQTGTLDGNVENLRQFGDFARRQGVEIGLWTQSDLHPKEGIEPLLQRDIVKEVRDAGVRVLKTDVAWVGAGYSFGLNGVADVGNIMPFYGNDARPFILSLDGWAGTQRYAGIWSGDQTGGDWEYIRFHIPTFIGSGLSGQPNISSDTDGIFGGKNPVVNAREFQWKTFTPMELNMDGWGANPKYAHVLGEPTTSINRNYLKLKSILLPYAYTAAHEAVTGEPLIRALFLEEPREFTYGTATQYEFLYGRSFLVAPVYKNTRADKDGNDQRDGIYLPAGRWIDYFSGDVYEGGRVINNFDAPLWKLPVFVKGDAIIPFTKANNSPQFIDKAYRGYDVYAYRGTTASEYDDDGKTQEYLRGGSVTTALSTSFAKPGELTFRIEPTRGTFTGFTPEKETEIVFHLTQPPKKITAKVGSRSVKLKAARSLADFEKGVNVYYYDPAPNLNRFSTAGTDIARLKVTTQPQLRVRLGKTNTAENGVSVVLRGFAYEPKSHLLRSTGRLETPKPTMRDITATTLTPAWDKVENADFYEVEANGMLYSTIRNGELLFDGLQPETDYDFKVRAVNASGYSQWATLTGTTVADPLEHAVKGVTAVTTCENQGGQGVNKLFDNDDKTLWHSLWAKAGEKGGSAIPFEMTIDLKGVNELDRLVYLPREDAGNGTLLEGTYALSEDKLTWTSPVAFSWAQDGSDKTLPLAGAKARYVRLNVTKAVGGFASGRSMYVFRVPGTEAVLQGDINRDKRIDDNDLTSYLNYTGLRRGDADFDYVSIGDINRNGLIDAYDISVVATQLDGGARETTEPVGGEIALTADKTSFRAGEEVRIAVRGKGMRIVNALSFALPYDANDLEYLGLELQGMKNLVNLTYDRLHTNGKKALYPTFANRGNDFLLEGDADLFVIRFRAKRAGKFAPKALDGLLVNRSLDTKKF